MARINVYTTDDMTGEKTLDGWFDDRRAEWIKEEEYWDGHNNRGVISNLQIGYEGLYRTKGCRWVRYYNARNEFDGPEYYEFLTDDQARTWLLRNGSEDLIEEYFGEVEEERGPGRPEVGKPINVRLGDELLARIDAEAKTRGKSRADTIRDLVAQAIA